MRQNRNTFGTTSVSLQPGAQRGATPGATQAGHKRGHKRTRAQRRTHARHEHGTRLPGWGVHQRTGSPNLRYYALGSICSICSVCSICSICSIGVYRFLKPYNVARNLHCLPISTAPAPPFYQFLPVSTAARSPFYPKKTEQNDREETQFYQFLPGVFFEILPLSTVFYRLLLC